MNDTLNRRQLLSGSLAAAAGAALTTSAAKVAAAEPVAQVAVVVETQPRKFEVGTVTYNFLKDATLEEAITTCERANFKCLELRSTHKHGVEPAMTKEERKAVRERFTKTPVKLFGLGSACEFHAEKPDVVKKNIEEAKAFVALAADVGAVGVKVRPNALPKSVAVEDTLKQIGHAAQEVAKFAEQHKVEIWFEVHGPGTSDPAAVKKIIDHAAHPLVGVTWNSNPTDLKNGSIAEGFALLKNHIRCVHIHDFYDPYPYRELFALLRGIGYDRFVEAESPETKDPLRVMKYYRAMFEMLA